MTRIKICGITNVEDGLRAAELGADALGFVFAESKRQVTPAQVTKIVASLPTEPVRVGIFVDENNEAIEKIIAQCGLTEVQLYFSDSKPLGSTPDSFEGLSVPYLLSHRVKNIQVIKEIKQAGRPAFHLDAYDPKLTGGTGRSFDWEIAAKASSLGQLHLAGGLTPENITEALERVKPFGVDVSSGVEEGSGRKDFRKMDEFIRKVRQWDNRTN